jgi:amino-acid N-acetyltransferase
MESKIIKASAHPYSMIKLLVAAKLPVEDLPASLENFRVAVVGKEVSGSIGLELYGEYGLLRSLAVEPAYRYNGIANNLLLAIEKLAIQKSVKAIYLLTETAPGYFARKGYEAISRDAVPDAVKASTEFAHVCPASAIVMKKEL